MKIIWQVEAEDIARVKEFFDLHRDNALVKMRVATNLTDDKPPVTGELFWEVMIACLLTTQQRSGPGSAVTKFISTNPCLLRRELCRGQTDLDVFVTKVLSEFGGLRRSTTIGREAKANWTYIDSRITKWLNDFGFPIRLTAKALADRNYFEFVSDGFQRLAEACGIAPCVLDAAIFSSFDEGGWTEENVVW